MDIDPKKIIIGFIAAFTLLAALIMAFGSYHIVPPGHRGVKVTLGTVDPGFVKEGFSFKAPFVSTVYDIPIKQQTAVGNEECFSADLQNIHVSYSVMYRTPEGKVVTLFQSYSGDPLTTLIKPRISEILKAETAFHRAEELAKNRDRVKGAVLEKIRASMKDLIYVEEVTINNMKLSPDLEKAIEQKTIREQEALAKSFELDKAKKDAEITVVNAEAEAKAVEIKGRALKSSPEVISLEVAKRWDGKSPSTVVIGEGKGTGFILPLR